MTAVRALRKAKGMTAKELADKCEVTEATISYVESGKRKPSYELLLKIAETLETTTDYLVSSATAPVDSFCLPNEAGRFSQIFNVLDEADKMVMLSIIESFAKKYGVK